MGLGSAANHMALLRASVLAHEREREKHVDYYDHPALRREPTREEIDRFNADTPKVAVAFVLLISAVFLFPLAVKWLLS